MNKYQYPTLYEQGEIIKYLNMKSDICKSDFILTPFVWSIVILN